MHPDQLPIDIAVVGALIREQFPTLEGGPVRQLSAGGTVNVIFRIGDGFAARFPLQPRIRSKLKPWKPRRRP